jgi:hypothetical protein
MEDSPTKSTSGFREKEESLDDKLLLEGDE